MDEENPPAGPGGAMTAACSAEAAAPSPIGSLADGPPPPPGGGGKEPVHFTLDLGRAICARVASGESQLSICADAGMPSRSTLFRWARDMPQFAADLAKARSAAGRKAGDTRPSTYCATTANEIFERMCEGESVSAICRDPAMPSFSTVYYWRRNNAAFAEMMRVAREVQAERYCEQGMEVAEAVTPETAHATRVRLAQLRWTAAHYWPRGFGSRKAVEPPAEPVAQTILLRHFVIETREDGWRRVVGYRADTENRIPVRDDEGPWTAPLPGEQLPARWRGEKERRGAAPPADEAHDPEGWT